MNPTTDGAVALVNLNAQITGRTTLGRRPDELVDLLLLRAHLLGRIQDYEHALSLAASSLSHARALAALHRFPEALATLEPSVPVILRTPPTPGQIVLKAEILQATGDFEKARVLFEQAAPSRPRFAVLGSEAALAADEADVGRADRLFGEAVTLCPGVSPFPAAQLHFRRGTMWLGQDATHLARSWLERARRLVPGYVPAQGHLARLDLLEGNPAAAAARVRPLLEISDDPAYESLLATALAATGATGEAAARRERATARYAELLTRHPEAYAHHVQPDHTAHPGGDHTCCRDR